MNRLDRIFNNLPFLAVMYFVYALAECAALYFNWGAFTKGFFIVACLTTAELLNLSKRWYNVVPWKSYKDPIITFVGLYTLLLLAYFLILYPLSWLGIEIPFNAFSIIKDLLICLIAIVVLKIALDVLSKLFGFKILDF